MSAFVAEIIGTAMILLFGCGVVAGVLLDKSKSNGGGWIVITIFMGHWRGVRDLCRRAVQRGAS